MLLGVGATDIGDIQFVKELEAPDDNGLVTAGENNGFVFPEPEAGLLKFVKAPGAWFIGVILDRPLFKYLSAMFSLYDRVSLAKSMLSKFSAQDWFIWA